MKSNSLFCVFALFLTLFSLSLSGFTQSFQRTTYGGQIEPADVFVSDLNHDGKPDLVVPQNSNFITVFLNHGDGTFPPGGSATYQIGGVIAARVVAADFNGDGNIDLAILSCIVGGQGVSILFGNKDGTFQSHVDYVITYSTPPVCEDSLGLITLANSKLPSLIASAEVSEIAVLVNDGHGVFNTQRTITGPAGRRLSGVSAGDYNGDNLQDIAAISSDFVGGPSQVVIFHENADQSFRPSVTIFTTASELQAANTVDFNGDGKGDLLVPFLAGPSNRAGVVALTNLGGGNFRTTTLTADPFYTFSSRKAAAIHPVGNLAGLHGIVALLSPDFGTGNSVFAFFPAQGTSWGQPIYFNNPSDGSQASANGDFNGDNKPDFAAVTNDGQLFVFLNTTTAATCGYPAAAGVRICSPALNSTGSLSAKIHASASGGALPIVAMKAYIDNKLVAQSEINTLDESVSVKAGKHTLAVNAWDPNDKVYQSIVKFTAK